MEGLIYVMLLMFVGFFLLMLIVVFISNPKGILELLFDYLKRILLKLGWKPKKDGPLDGPYKYYYKNGQLEFEINYKNGKRDGPYKMYYENGQLKEEGNFKDNKEEGLWKNYNKKGQLKKEIVYEDGKFKDEVKKKTTYHSKKSIENDNGFNRKHLEDGGYQECYKENGVMTKDLKIYNKKGVLTLHIDKLIEKGDNIIVNGKELSYYDDGSLKSDTYFIKGKREGFGIEYDEEEKIIQIDYYKDDEDISWDSDKNKKIVLRKIKDYLNNGVEVYPVQYYGKCKSLGIDVNKFLNEPNFKI